ncbi:glycosyltransferase family 4 protein [Coralliovum pocilloporae]|uniref:glycosyltransferase family 4 protein n=1 Tax=Coralliovum pocilloporae TaxID=3066369 RepID=UPI0033078FA8
MHQQNARIVHCVRSPVGGIFRHIEDLIRHQSAEGNAVGLIYDSLTEGPVERAHAERMAPYLALGAHTVPMARSLGPADAFSVMRIHRLVRSMAPDILHGHGAKGGAYSRMLGGLNSIMRRPLVTLYSPHGGSLHYDPQSLKGKLFFSLERFLERWTSSLVFVCQYEKNVYSNKVGSPCCPAAVIHNGVRPEEFEPVAEADSISDFVFFGTLRDLKGPDLFLSAITQLPSETRADIVGDGPDRPRYEAMAAELGLKERITFHGSRPPRETFGLGRCVVMPSRAESFPYAVLEALAAAKPVITTNVGGISEMFQASDSRLIPADDVASLVTAMAQFQQNTTAWQARAQDEQLFIKTHFQASQMAETVSNLYRDLLRSVSATS